ncbi:hypothetical protein AB0D47_03335 [Streptomyces sp. NPDC048376]|uniref:hypothetical protein n=1 Tax=unclassified Streptomyces TaxID=2593676 RepID=UPI0034166888
MSDPLHRIADAVADVTESDAVAVLTALGLQKDQRQPAGLAWNNGSTNPSPLADRV